MSASALRRLTSAAVVAAALCLTPAAASAADLCVGATPGCSGSSFPFTGAGLQSAFGAAGADVTSPDRVVLAAGTLPITTGITATAAGNVELVGAGKDATTISYSGNGSVAFTAGNGGGSTTKIRDLSIKRISADPNAQSYVLSAYGVTVERVGVSEESGSNNVIALYLGSGTLVESTVSTNSGADSGVLLYGLTGDISDSTIASQNPVRISGGNHVISRSRLTGAHVGVTMDSGTLAVRDSLIDVSANPNAIAVGILNYNNGSSPLTATVTRSTVVGSGSGQRGIVIQGDSPNEIATGTINDTVVALSGSGSTDLSCVQGSGGTATLSTSHSAFATIAKQGNCVPTHVGRIDSSVTPLRFVDPAAGDFRPRFNSPLVDAGVSVPAAGETLDVLGNVRLIDGNGSAGAQADVGAAECQRAAPAVTLTAPAALETGQLLEASASASDADGEALTYTWSLGDGDVADGTAVTHVYAAAGPYQLTLKVADASGVSTTKKQIIAVSAPAAQGSGNGQQPEQSPGEEPQQGPGEAPQQSGGSDLPQPQGDQPRIGPIEPVNPPVVSLVTKPKSAIRRSSKGFALATQASRRTLGMKLASVDALELTLAKQVKGHRVALKGRVRVAVSGSAAELTLGGKFASKRLAAGTYRLTLTPVRGALKGQPITVAIRIAK